MTDYNISTLIATNNKISSSLTNVSSVLDSVKSDLENASDNLKILSDKNLLNETTINRLMFELIDAKIEFEDDIKQCRFDFEKKLNGLTDISNLSSGNINSLPIGFNSSFNTGLYSPDTNVVGFVSCASLKLAVAPDEIILYDTLVIKDSNISTPAISSEGHLYKKKNNAGLFWNTTSGEIDITKTNYPLLASNGDVNNPVYSFVEESNTGIYKSNLAGLGISVKGSHILDVTNTGIAVSGQIHISDSAKNPDKNSLYTKTDSNDLFWYDGGREINVTAKFNGGVINNDLLVNDLISKGVETYSVKADKVEADRLESRELKADTIFLSSNKLEAVGGHLLYNNVNLLERYNEHVPYNAKSNIKYGDVVCLCSDGVTKAEGGRWYNEKNNIKKCKTQIIKNKSMDMFYVLSIDDDMVLNVYKFQNKIITQKNGIKINEATQDCQISNIIDIGNDKYVFAYAATHRNCVNICMVYVNDNIECAILDTKQIQFSNEIENFSITYDTSIDTVIFVSYSSFISNYVMAMLQYNYDDKLLLGTVCESVSIDHVVELSDKNIKIISIPGQIALINHGSRKLAVAITSYDSTITVGEIFIDYESYDCADTIYDINSGIIISVEKTNASTCFIQILDILGTKIQKLSSKKFNNAFTMHPMGLVYDSCVNNYLMLFSDSNGVVNIQHIDFDGESLYYGLSYKTQDMCDNIQCKGQHIYVMNNIAISLWNNNIDTTIRYFENDYQSNPASFVGLSKSNVSIGDMCNVCIRGHIFNSDLNLPMIYLGKKLYLSDLEESFPNTLSISSYNGVFIGTCVGPNSILVGL
jgi:hypothetical protein